ncbi:hypothetical protein GTP81_25495 [Rugamonas sp. FT107W]|uniref:Uncharacterized protein n=1 Tax=Duganella vulcania TaxID=2692166 RepID=A0A845HMT2_9BURK|nr:hypothetical protein [Duganella vulcania]MYN20101.1 hypothetical protein [Duganella vulcania]
MQHRSHSITKNLNPKNEIPYPAGLTSAGRQPAGSIAAPYVASLQHASARRSFPAAFAQTGFSWQHAAALTYKITNVE